MIHKPSGMGQPSTIYIQYMYDWGRRNIDYNVNVGREALRVRLRGGPDGAAHKSKRKAIKLCKVNRKGTGK